MADQLSAFIKPGFPKESVSADGYSTIIEYVGPKDSLYGIVIQGEAWGDYRGKVEDIQGDPQAGTEYASLTVRMLAKFGDDQSPATQEGTLEEVIYEIDWISVPKNLIDHPEFGATGAFALTDDDKADLEYWEAMPKELKNGFYFFKGNFDPQVNSVGECESLGDNATKYAVGRLLGIETWIARLPLLRKSSTYKNGVPPYGDGVGQQGDPIGFPFMPLEFEYIKEADRSTNTGKQNEWRRDEEWQGVDRVLIDAKNIFW